MGAIPVVLESAGLGPGDYRAAAAGDTLANTGRTRLAVQNASGAPVDVTVHAARACSHGFVDDEVITVPAGSGILSLELPVRRFGTAPDVTYSATAGVLVAGVEGSAYDS